MSFKNYYNQLNSQSGIKAYIKKKLFTNLLKELVKQEKEIEKQRETIKARTIALKEQERVYARSVVWGRSQQCDDCPS